MSSVHVIVLCGGKSHCLEVTESVVVILDHDESVERVSAHFGGGLPACIRVSDHVRRVHRKRRYQDEPLHEVASFASMVGSDDAQEWLEAGVVTAEALEEWKQLGVTQPQQARGWQMPAMQAARWHEQGWTHPEATLWSRHGFDAETATLWKGLIPRRCTAKRAAAWLAAGWSPDDAAPWLSANVHDPSHAKVWCAQGLGPTEAKRREREGIVPDLVWVDIPSSGGAYKAAVNIRNKLVVEPVEPGPCRLPGAPASLWVDLTREAVNSAAKSGWNPSREEAAEALRLLFNAFDPPVPATGTLAVYLPSRGVPARDISQGDRVDVGIDGHRPSILRLPPPLRFHEPQRFEPTNQEGSNHPLPSTVLDIAPDAVRLVDDTEWDVWGTKTGQVVHLYERCASRAHIPRRVPVSSAVVCKRCWEDAPSHPNPDVSSFARLLMWAAVAADAEQALAAQRDGALWDPYTELHTLERVTAPQDPGLVIQDSVLVPVSRRFAELANQRTALLRDESAKLADGGGLSERLMDVCAVALAFGIQVGTDMWAVDPRFAAEASPLMYPRACCPEAATIFREKSRQGTSLLVDRAHLAGKSRVGGVVEIDRINETVTSWLSGDWANQVLRDNRERLRELCDFLRPLAQTMTAPHLICGKYLAWSGQGPRIARLTLRHWGVTLHGDRWGVGWAAVVPEIVARTLILSGRPFATFTVADPSRVDLGVVAEAATFSMETAGLLYGEPVVFYH